MKEISIYSFMRAELGGLFRPADRLCFVAIPQGVGERTKKYCKTEHYFGTREEMLTSERLSSFRKKKQQWIQPLFFYMPAEAFCDKSQK
ncbi:hypothetical protein [Cloacibacillus porcorum]